MINVQAAGFGVRFGAAIVDFIIGCMFAGLIFMILGVMLGNVKPELDKKNIDFLVIIIPFTITFLCALLFYKLSWHATPGKRFLGIKVVSASGKEVSWKQAALVSVFTLAQFILLFPVFGMFLSHAKLTFIVGAMVLIASYITIFFTENRTAIQDIICDTKVVYKEYKEEEIVNIDQFGIIAADGDNWHWKPNNLFLFNRKGTTFLLNKQQKDRVIFYSSKLSSLPIIAGIYFICRGYGVGAAEKTIDPVYIAIGMFITLVSVIYFSAGLVFFYRLMHKCNKV